MFAKELKKTITAKVMRLVVAMAALVMVSLALSGCSTKQDPVPKVTFIYPDDELLVDCDIRQPPNQTYFIELDPIKKLDVLFDDMGYRIVDAGICNARLGKVRQWKQWAKDKEKENK